MQLNSPFGPMQLIFFRDFHGKFYVNGLESIVVNRVEYKVDCEIVKVDGVWQRGRIDNSGKPYSCGAAEIRFDDWSKRKGYPSDSARDKIIGYVDSIVAEINAGKYADRIFSAEVNYFNAEKNRAFAQIAEKRREIANLEKYANEMEEKIKQLTASIAPAA